jgi:hypothetical protein
MDIRKIIKEEMDNFDWADNVDVINIYNLAEKHFSGLKPLTIEKDGLCGFNIKKMNEMWRGKRVPTALIEVTFKWSEETNFRNKLNELTKSFTEDYGDHYPLRVINRINKNSYKKFEEGGRLHNYYQQFGSVTIEVLDPS